MKRIAFLLIVIVVLCLYLGQQYLKDSRTSNTAETTNSAQNLNFRGKLEGAQVFYVRDVRKKDESIYVEVDYAEWFTDTEENGYAATRICVQEEDCQCLDGTTGQNCLIQLDQTPTALVPNGYYVHNPIQDAQAYDLTSSADVSIYDTGGVQARKVTPQELYTYFQQKEIQLYIKHAPYNVKIENAKITQLQQRYIP